MMRHFQQQLWLVITGRFWGSSALQGEQSELQSLFLSLFCRPLYISDVSIFGMVFNIEDTSPSTVYYTKQQFCFIEYTVVFWWVWQMLADQCYPCYPQLDDRVAPSMTLSNMITSGCGGKISGRLSLYKVYTSFWLHVFFRSSSPPLLHLPITHTSPPHTLHTHPYIHTLTDTHIHTHAHTHHKSSPPLQHLLVIHILPYTPPPPTHTHTSNDISRCVETHLINSFSGSL